MDAVRRAARRTIIRWVPGRRADRMRTHRWESLPALLTYLRWTDQGKRAQRLKEDWRGERRTETLTRLGSIAISVAIIEAVLAALGTRSPEQLAILTIGPATRAGAYAGMLTSALWGGAADLTVMLVGRERYERIALAAAGRKLRGTGDDAWPVVAQLLRVSCGKHLDETDTSARWALPRTQNQVTEREKARAERILKRLQNLPLQELSESSQAIAGRDEGCWRCGAAGIRSKVSDIEAYAASPAHSRRMVTHLQKRWGENWGSSTVPAWQRLPWDDEMLFSDFTYALEQPLTTAQAEAVIGMADSWNGDIRQLIRVGRAIA